MVEDTKVGLGETLKAKNIKKVLSKPWKPAKILEIPEKLKNSNFTYRWVSKDRPGNVRKKLSEGWEFDTELTKKLTDLPKTLQDGSNLDSTFQVRGLVVMKMPKELAAERSKYYGDRSKRKIKELSQVYGGETEGAGYGRITVEEK